MILTKRIPRLDSKAKLLSIVTIAHGTNDFYGVVLAVLLPVIVLDFGFSYTQFGVVLLITTISSGLLPPVFGFLADRHGIQKQVVMMGFLMFALGLVGFSIAASFLTLIVASLIYGLGQTTYHPQATSLITSIFSENKGRAMGVHGIGGSVGNFLAPITVAFLITLVDWRMTAILLAIPTITLIGVTFTTWKNRPKNLNLTLTSGITRNVIVLGVTTGFITMFYKGFLAFLPTWLLENGVTLTSAGRDYIPYAGDRHHRPASWWGALRSIWWADFVYLECHCGRNCLNAHDRGWGVAGNPDDRGDWCCPGNDISRWIDDGECLGNWGRCWYECGSCVWHWRTHVGRYLIRYRISGRSIWVGSCDSTTGRLAGIDRAYGDLRATSGETQKKAQSRLIVPMIQSLGYTPMQHSSQSRRYTPTR